MNTLIAQEAKPGFLDRFSGAWSHWKQRRAAARADVDARGELAHELACLEQGGELEGALGNLGFGPGAVPFLLENYAGAMRRYAAMTSRLGVATARVPSAEAGLAALFGPRRRCLLCPAAKRCEQWLRRGEGAACGAAPSFCPNRDVFQRMRTAKPQ